MSHCQSWTQVLVFIAYRITLLNQGVLVLTTYLACTPDVFNSTQRPQLTFTTQ
ncbi:hypothetical protein PLICRDRAFT_145135, partial [Plicaturopsis crispa FD-325 SS-3]